MSEMIYHGRTDGVFYTSRLGEFLRAEMDGENVLYSKIEDRHTRKIIEVYHVPEGVTVLSLFTLENIDGMNPTDWRAYVYLYGEQEARKCVKDRILEEHAKCRAAERTLPDHTELQTGRGVTICH